MKRKWIIEVDITHRCNMACRHCNRFCNAKAMYGISREKKDMKKEHIDFLCSEIRRQSAGKIGILRIIGGEPLLSPIITYAIDMFEGLLNNKYIDAIHVVTNGTVEVPECCASYIVYAPECVGDIIKSQGRILTTAEVYFIKNVKHRNITLCPMDFNLVYNICDRIDVCGIQYSVYGFSYTAACFPAMLISSVNHKRFLYHIPNSITDFFDDDFKDSVCAICVYAICDYKKMVELNPAIQLQTHIGTTWNKIINDNKLSYKEPDVLWIEYNSDYGVK